MKVINYIIREAIDEDSMKLLKSIKGKMLKMLFATNFDDLDYVQHHACWVYGELMIEFDNGLILVPKIDTYVENDGKEVFKISFSSSEESPQLSQFQPFQLKEDFTVKSIRIFGEKTKWDYSWEKISKVFDRESKMPDRVICDIQTETIILFESLLGQVLALCVDESPFFSISMNHKWIEELVNEKTYFERNEKYYKFQRKL